MFVPLSVIFVPHTSFPKKKGEDGREGLDSPYEKKHMIYGGETIVDVIDTINDLNNEGKHMFCKYYLHKFVQVLHKLPFDISSIMGLFDLIQMVPFVSDRACLEVFEYLNCKLRSCPSSDVMIYSPYATKVCCSLAHGHRKVIPSFDLMLSLTLSLESNDHHNPHLTSLLDGFNFRLWHDDAIQLLLYRRSRDCLIRCGQVDNRRDASTFLKTLFRFPQVREMINSFVFCHAGALKNSGDFQDVARHALSGLDVWLIVSFHKQGEKWMTAHLSVELHDMLKEKFSSGPALEKGCAEREGSLCCPITLLPFFDPVVASDGHTYERWAILQHFSQNGFVSPVTNLPLYSTDLFTNYVLRTTFFSN